MDLRSTPQIPDPVYLGQDMYFVRTTRLPSLKMHSIVNNVINKLDQNEIEC